MTPAERADAVQRLGYTPIQAAFLALAAVHGGYFLRRQYLAFARQVNGRRTVLFLDALQARGHGDRTTYYRRTHVYHVSSRTLYAAIGEEHNRNRRRVEPITITRKLMTLDYVLTQPDAEFYATEREKVRLFTEDLGVDWMHLPSRTYSSESRSASPVTRYFVEKFPIARRPGVPGLAFAYVSTDAPGSPAFLGFIDSHRALWAQLPAVQVVYVCAGADWGAEAARQFARAVSSAQGNSSPDLSSPTAQELIAHFHARRALGLGQVHAFDQARLDRLRLDLRRFATPELEALYQTWKTHGDGAVFTHCTSESPGPALNHVTFEACHLPFQYRCFGDITPKPHRPTVDACPPPFPHTSSGDITAKRR